MTNDEQEKLRTRAWFTLAKLNLICRDSCVRLLERQHGEEWLSKLVDEDFEVKPPLPHNTLKEIRSLQRQEDWNFGADFFEIKHLARHLKKYDDPRLFEELLATWAFVKGDLTKGPDSYLRHFLCDTLFECNRLRGLVMHHSCITREQVDYLDSVLGLLQALVKERQHRHQPPVTDEEAIAIPSGVMRDIVYACCGIPGGVPVDHLREYYVQHAMQQGTNSAAAIQGYAELLGRLQDHGDVSEKGGKVFLLNSTAFWGAVPELRRIHRARSLYERLAAEQGKSLDTDLDFAAVLDEDGEPLGLDASIKDPYKSEMERLVDYQRRFFSFVCERALRAIPGEMIQHMGIEPSCIHFDCIVDGPSYYINQIDTHYPLGLAGERREWLQNHLRENEYPPDLIRWLDELDGKMRQLDARVLDVVRRLNSQTIIYLEGSVSLSGQGYGTNLFEYDHDAVFFACYLLVHRWPLVPTGFDKESGRPFTGEWEPYTAMFTDPQYAEFEGIDLADLKEGQVELFTRIWEPVRALQDPIIRMPEEPIPGEWILTLHPDAEPGSIEFGRLTCHEQIVEHVLEYLRHVFPASYTHHRFNGRHEACYYFGYPEGDKNLTLDQAIDMHRRAPRYHFGDPEGDK